LLWRHRNERGQNELMIWPPARRRAATQPTVGLRAPPLATTAADNNNINNNNILLFTLAARSPAARDGATGPAWSVDREID
jgi:hypothetical protein